ncbi:MAG: AAA family ATPase [Candidatus Aminicenantes bacterium]|nr:AAA family ATPase [Candidatus Aminicenantes bacterium]NIM83740.1 AAA family ATPase [Candidatus Aminicenantes bacterium]NIN23200.1 AAA family ATPase [Candidatus Aminicenantes bacterium]NIN46894.1 AAA family ATPase [Candidatus Aminicenantes bacterium]NIN89816.1 AAA family ATPase [Candidatus Aminicenantes bacterium]
MNLPLFQKIIKDFQIRPLPSLTQRDLKLSFIKDMSLAIVGTRRGGKTYRTFQFINELMQQGVGKENFCRVQFNDHRLRSTAVDHLHIIDEAFYSLYPDKQQKEVVYFIFDEIHRITGWEDYILYLLEDPLHRILLTGSTSKLLKGQIASALRGKNFSMELFPFSFREFIRHYHVEEDTISSQGQSKLRKMLQKYLGQGGFPGLLDLEAHLHIDLLQSYWDTMVLRDIIEAHPKDNIKITSFNHFSQALLSRVSCAMTVRKIMTNMEIAGLSFSPETLYRYLGYLEEAFMLYTIPIHSESEKIRNRNYRKVYAMDWALADAIAPAEGLDIPRKFENMIFIELLRRGYQVSYYLTKKNYEIDFIATNKTGEKTAKHLYQVCYQFSDPGVRERELRGILETASFLNIRDIFVITFNEEETIDMNGFTVKVLPAWKWLIKDAEK